MPRFLHASFAGPLACALTLLAGCSSYAAAQNVKYGAGALVPSRGQAATPNRAAIIYHVTSNGESVLGPSGEFIPVRESFTAGGPFTSGVLRGDGAIVAGKERAVITGWTHLKRGELVVGWALRLGNGQIVVPINRPLLELVLAGASTAVPRRAPTDRYPTAGRTTARLTGFTEAGAVLEMGQGGGIYVMSGEDAEYISLADDAHFMSIDTTPGLKAESRTRLDALKR